MLAMPEKKHCIFFSDYVICVLMGNNYCQRCKWHKIYRFNMRPKKEEEKEEEEIISQFVTTVPLLYAG